MSNDKLQVKVGCLTLERTMSRSGAMRYGMRGMPKDLKRAGFECFVSKSDPEMHGGTWYRISYGKDV